MPKARIAKSKELPGTAGLLRQNAILNGLDEKAIARILPSCRVGELRIREKIYEPEQPIRQVYFAIRCVISVVSQMKNGSQIEIGTIGREGMSAFPLLMGASATANDSYCQVPGMAVTMSVDVFRGLSQSNRAFRQQLDRYLQAYVNVLGQLAACNRLHNVYERCSRWLLMTRDRVNRDDIPPTQEYLAMMLGTNRSGVTLASGVLQQSGFIRYAHGVIRILDRVGLENASCECYEVASEQFGGLLRSIKSP
jgi:CRP-like cAMP-binding protein